MLLPVAQRRALPAAGAGLPAAVAFELTDLAARLVSVRARLGQIEAELVRVAQPLPVYALLRTLPGIGPTRAAILLAETCLPTGRSGTSRGTTKFSQLRKLAGLDIIRIASGQWAGTARISRGGRPLLRWALYQAALGAARTLAWRARREAMITKRQGDPHAFFKANIELAAKLLRLAWGIWRSGRPYDPARVDGGAPWRQGPAARPRPKRGRRAAPPSGKGQGPIGKPRGSQAARSPDKGALDRRAGT